METQTRKTGRFTKFLIICAGLVGLLTAVILFLSLPYLQESPATPTEAPTAPPTQAVTEAPTEPPTEEPPETEEPTEPEPTLPPEYHNPYGQLDFQFNGRYLECIKAETLTGIDVSAHQQQIDWKWVKASGVDFAMIRIGYRGYESGKLVMDSYAQANLEGAAAVGLPIGIYFFSQALNVEEAREEAAFVLDAIADYEITMPVVFDWENVSDEDARSHGMDRRTLTDCALAFLGDIQDAGYTPMIYFNSYQSQTMLYLDELTDFEFWLAMYTARMDYPYRVRMWQYTDEGTVPGITGNADINVWFVEN